MKPIAALAALLLTATLASAQQTALESIERDARSIFRSERIQIRADGRVRILRQEIGRPPNPVQGRATPTQLAALREALEKARFAEVASDPTANPPVGESLLTYTVRGGPQAHTVVVAAKDKDARLDPVDAAIDAIRQAVLGETPPLPPPPPTATTAETPPPTGGVAGAVPQ